MSELEHRYRAAIRWYPRRWRARHEEALLGILLDQAEAEGRMHMSSADRRDLARRGLQRRLSPVLLGGVIVLGGLAVSLAARMLADGVGFDVEYFFSPPALHPVPVGSGWTPPFMIAFSSGTLYLVCAVVLVGAVAGAAPLIRGMRRA